MNSIVSGNSLEPKNVFLCQKTTELSMIFVKKIVLKNVKKIAIFAVWIFFVFLTWRPQFWSDLAKVGLVLSERPNTIYIHLVLVSGYPNS